ncbi:uncharacterized protein LOC128990308 isoform X1 [Macrosteles quadrilineatus]|uniref:uncharacterized protein LOC128990308 isoform X1 n=1 Tax=Macrosteles quadrilineatus TaxID=74068 RepID=UPI0023E1253F|nr:uncharacterized protein LOC128990308 isoform X1 [Macrosteles quadrilineatus]
MSGQHLYNIFSVLVSLQVLWVAVLLTSTAESSLAVPREVLTSLGDTVTYQRAKRSPDEETFQPRIPKKVEDYEITEDDFNDTQVTSQQTSSEEVSLDNEDEAKETPQVIKDQKNKQNEPKKYNASEFKKVAAEIKPSNDSAGEKPKLPIYNPNPVIKYNNSFKKDSKLNSSVDSSFKADSSNLKVPSKFMRKVKGDVIEGPVNTTKVASLNETRLMSDQPVAIESESDAVNNSTDISDDETLDGLLQNSTSISEDNSTSADGRKMPSEDLNIVLISGVTLGTAALLAVVAGGGFIYYRHRMWNKPQTLSDKCSNADSSGYIDDSTLRENSEEMYSLDNDSFLNSLEAMTIQNYWTDNVKHTKL